MRYSILGFNQAKLLQFNLNLSEVLLLSYIYDAQASPTMSHIIEDEKTYTWLNHSKIQSDLPILNVNERQLKYYLNHLTSYNLITAKQTSVTGIKGSRAYYGITEICESLRYDNTDTEQGQKIAPNDPLLGAKNCPSDNQLLLDSKLENSTISKDIVAKASPEISQENTQDNPRQPYIENDTEGLSEFEQHMYSDDVRKKRKIEGATTPKAKKLSLWDKCVQAIEEYTDNEQLQEALTDYLKLRLSMRDKPIYIAQWKALLKKIDTCSGDPVQVVKQSTELGYASFYDLKTYTRPRRVDIISSETENMSCRKVSAEERREILEHGELF